MNKTRKKELDLAVQKMEEIKNDVQRLLEEEEQYFDDMPENMQGGEKGERAEYAISSMEVAISSLEDAIDGLNGIE